MLNRRNFIKAGLGLGAGMLVPFAAACSDSKPAGKAEAKGHVYYLNFKPESDEQWKEIADIYKQETLSLIHI